MSNPTDNNKLRKRKRLAKNAMFSAITSLADVFLLILLILCGRLLGAEMFGIFTFALAIATLLVFLTNLGLDSLAIRQIAIQKENASFIIGAVLTWKTVILSVFLIIFALAANALTSNTVILNLLYILAPASIFRSLNMTFRSFIQAFEIFHLETAIVLTERILLFTLGLGALWHFRDPTSLAWAFLVSRAATSLIYLYIIETRLCHTIPVFDPRFIYSFQVKAFPLGVATILFGIYSQIDVIMLGMYMPAESIGYFSSAMKIYEGALVIPLIINSAIYPRLSYLFVHDSSRFHDLLNRGFKYLAIAAILSSTIALFYSQFLISLLFGQNFIQASQSLVILIIAVSSFYLLSIIHTALKAMGLQRFVMYIMATGLITKFTFNLLLIPILGINGAASTVLISSITMTSIALYILGKKGYRVQAIVFPILKSFASAIFAIVVAKYTFMVQPLIQLPATIFLFLIFLFAFRTFDKFEVELISNLVPKILHK